MVLDAVDLAGEEEKPAAFLANRLQTALAQRHAEALSHLAERWPQTRVAEAWRVAVGSDIAGPAVPHSRVWLSHRLSVEGYVKGEHARHSRSTASGAEMPKELKQEFERAVLKEKRSGQSPDLHLPRKACISTVRSSDTQSQTALSKHLLRRGAASVANKRKDGISKLALMARGVEVLALEWKGTSRSGIAVEERAKSASGVQQSVDRGPLEASREVAETRRREPSVDYSKAKRPSSAPAAIMCRSARTKTAGLSNPRPGQLLLAPVSARAQIVRASGHKAAFAPGHPPSALAGKKLPVPVGERVRHQVEECLNAGACQVFAR